jgi:copper chaperone CopZ
MQQIVWSVEGMSCQGCARSVQGIISKGLAVEREQVKVELEQKRAEFSAPEGAALSEIVEALKAKGFLATPQGA